MKLSKLAQMELESRPPDAVTGPLAPSYPSDAVTGPLAPSYDEVLSRVFRFIGRPKRNGDDFGLSAATFAFFDVDGDGTISLAEYNEKILLHSKSRGKPTDDPNASVPTLMPSDRCPSLTDVLNTPRSMRWEMWDDSTGMCVNECFTSPRSKCPPTGTTLGNGIALLMRLVPCCVKRRAAVWTSNCSTLPRGCSGVPLSRVGGGSWFAPRALAMRDTTGTEMPILSPSGSCPTREDVLNTPYHARWRLWADGDGQLNTEAELACAEGCNLHWCMGGRQAPCCVKRLKATWNVTCEELPKGCHNPEVAKRGGYVEDLWKVHGRLATPTLERTSSCPSFTDIENTQRDELVRLWGDGSDSRVSTFPWIDGTRCAEGCAMSKDCYNLGLPCCVKRMRVVSWPIACSQLRHGCEYASALDSTSNAPSLDASATSNLTGGTPHANSSAHPNKAVALEVSLGVYGPTGSAIYDHHAVPTLEVSSECPSMVEIMNTYASTYPRTASRPPTSSSGTLTPPQSISLAAYRLLQSSNPATYHLLERSQRSHLPIISPCNLQGTSISMGLVGGQIGARRLQDGRLYRQRAVRRRAQARGLMARSVCAAAVWL